MSLYDTENAVAALENFPPWKFGNESWMP